MNPEINWELLRRVSRSFYLTLRALPAEIRPELCQGYLLARASDSIADLAEVSRLERRTVLRNWAEGRVEAMELAGLPPAEARLLREAPKVYAAVRGNDRLLKMWRTILQGQQFDLERFENPEPLTRPELEHYTYSVAGCVGEFWTDLCLHRLPNFSSAPSAWLRERGIEFGKALQWINILRDRETDAFRGRIYVADSERGYAQERLAAGLRAAREYVDALRPGRLKFACALPLRLAHRTWERIEITPSGAAKISRSAVYVELLKSIAQGLTPARISPKSTE